MIHPKPDKWVAEPITDRTLLSEEARCILVDIEMTDLPFTGKMDLLAQVFAAITHNEMARLNMRLASGRNRVDAKQGAATALEWFSVQALAFCRRHGAKGK